MMPEDFDTTDVEDRMNNLFENDSPLAKAGGMSSLLENALDSLGEPENEVEEIAMQKIAYAAENVGDVAVAAAKEAREDVKR